jgi:hypothetical protein
VLPPVGQALVRPLGVSLIRRCPRRHRHHPHRCPHRLLLAQAQCRIDYTHVREERDTRKRRLCRNMCPPHRTPRWLDCTFPPSHWITLLLFPIFKIQVSWDFPTVSTVFDFVIPQCRECNMSALFRYPNSCTCHTYEPYTDLCQVW